MKERNVLLDCLKGFAIILVVVGHAIQYFLPHSFDANVVFRVIYSFHMPLFMFLSGFIGYKTFDGTTKKLAKRFNSLIVPFFAWFFVDFLFSFGRSLFSGGEQPNFLGLLKNVVRDPQNGLWFLWVLFLCYIVLFFSLRISKKREEVFAALFFVVLNILLITVPQANYFGLHLLGWYLLFYLFGYITSKHFERVKGLFKFAGIASIFLFPIAVIFWSREGNPYFLHNLAIGGRLATVISFGYKIFVPVLGILAMYTIFEKLITLKFFDPLKKLLTYLGGISLEIYVTHFYFFGIVFLPIFPFELQIFFGAIIALGGSVIVQKLFKKSNILSTVLFGKNMVK